MFKFLQHWKNLAGTPSLVAAVKRIFQTGLNTLEVGEDVKELQRKYESMQAEHLEMAQMVHVYETKLVNLERRAYDAEEKNKRLEWAHVAVTRENHWMKQELLDAKRQRQRTKKHPKG